MHDARYAEFMAVLGIFSFLGIALSIHALITNHAETWNRLGRPGILHWLANARLGYFLFIGGAHRRLGDDRLGNVVDTTRIIFAAFVFMIVLRQIYT